MNPFRRKPRTSGPLRVLFVVPDLRVGGAERHAATLAPALDPARFTASLVCIGEEGELFAGLGVPATALRSRTNPVRALLGLVRIMLRERPDVVVTRGYNAEALGRIAAALTRVPRTVVWVHNCGDVEPRGRVRWLVDRVLDPVTDAYYAVAHGQRPYMTDELGYPDAKITVIHNGVEPDRYPARPPVRDADVRAELGIPVAAPVIGVVAVLRPEKDHAMLLRATRSVLAELPEARLVVIGDGPERTRLEKLAAELGIAAAVVFAGSRADVPRLLGAVDVLALGSYTVECFPMAVLEAMASGVPVVATAIGGVPELVDDGVTGRVVPKQDPAAMAEALLDVLRDPARAEAMGRAGRRRVETEFSLDASVRAAQDAFLRTAGRGRPVRLTVVMDLTFVGGAEMLLLNVLRRMDRDAVRPRLVCLREAGPLADEFRAAGVPVEVLERTGRWDLSTVPRLVRSLRADRTDVVLVNHHHRAALTLGRLAARLAGVPANVVAAHDMDLTAVGGRVLPRHDVETLFLSSALVLLAPSQGRYLREQEGVGSRPWRRTREVVIGNGVELPAAADRATGRALLGLDDDAQVIGIVARLSPQKAHEVLLRAVAALAPSRAGLRLVVVGEGPRAAELQALAAELGIADRVLFTGVRRDVDRLLPAFDVTCLSSVHEGAPLIVLESMAAGVPVVATDVGAIADLVADGLEGRLVPSGNSDALAAALADLVDDPRLRAAMGARARARAERSHSIDRTVEGYTALLEELVAR
ncbi:glycosyltransferase [Pseudonocardia sp. CA-107938]|uniref:glycosyltransferase n=1 Tax=Pseudonocardia sp. CA-107938 TaxID=3240021 RepID=UPI003D8C85A3